MKKRSLKPKPATALKPASSVPETARELEREAPAYSQASPAVPKAQKPDQSVASAPIESLREAAPAPVKASSPTAPQTLKPVTSVPAAARELEREAPSQTASPAASQAVTTDEKVEVRREEAKPAQASSATPASAAAEKPSPPLSKTTASPHGTRPATLYYSSSPRKEKPAAPHAATSSSPTPMKTTPGAASSSAPSSAQSVATRVAPSSTVRPATVADFRSNVERQSREQKSVGNLLSYIVYGLLFLFVAGAALAGYGTYVLSEQIRQQSVTVNDLDKKYAGQVADLNAKLDATNAALTQSQAEITKQADLITKQQDALTKLTTATQTLADALRQERRARTDETASLRTRVKNLEYHGPGEQQNH